MPAIGGQEGPMPSADMLGMGGMGGPQQPGQAGANPADAIEGVIKQIRDLDQQAQALGSTMPALQQDVQQIRQAIKRMVIKAGQSMPAAGQSESALPMGG